MKKIMLLSLFAVFFTAINATNGTFPNDTIFKYKNRVVSIKTEKDSLDISILPQSHETDSLLNASIKPQVESSIIYDGSNYNFAFSWKRKNRLSSHWAGFGMSFMNYDDKNIPQGALKQSRSHNFSLNLFEYYSQIARSNWLLVTGIGFDWSRYHFDNNVALTKKDGVTVFEPGADGIDYASSKLLAYYVTVPLLLEYQIPMSRKGSFHISGGVVGFFKYYSKSQVKYYTDDKKHVVNKGRDLNIRPVDMKFRLQVGFNDISVFGYYSPFSMFNDDKGPDMKMYSIGAMLTF